MPHSPSPGPTGTTWKGTGEGKDVKVVGRAAGVETTAFQGSWLNSCAIPATLLLAPPLHPSPPLPTSSPHQPPLPASFWPPHPCSAVHGACCQQRAVGWLPPTPAPLPLTLPPACAPPPPANQSPLRTPLQSQPPAAFPNVMAAGLWCLMHTAAPGPTPRMQALGAPSSSLPPCTPPLFQSAPNTPPRLMNSHCHPNSHFSGP